MKPQDELTEALRCLEAACDAAACKGVKSPAMLQGMLSIFVSSRLGFGVSVEAVRHEFEEALQEHARFLAKNPLLEVGPPLGKGGN